MSPNQKQQVFAEMREKAQTAWAQLLEAVTGGVNSSDSGPED